MNRFVVLSGCSGGGKSTLLVELAKRGHHCVEEPGRRIVAQEQASDGTALPWVDVEAFLTLAIDVSRRDLAKAGLNDGWTFFDRGLVDATSALAQVTGTPCTHYVSAELAYHPLVFLTPPWPEIYVRDTQRQHTLSQAVEEYERLLTDFPLLGYQVVVLPKISVQERADFVLQQLGL